MKIVKHLLPIIAMAIYIGALWLAGGWKGLFAVVVCFFFLVLLSWAMRKKNNH